MGKKLMISLIIVFIGGLIQGYTGFGGGTILKVKGNYGTYNNKTNDMRFKENIIVEFVVINQK